MSVLKEIEEFIEDFNNDNNEKFKIDTLRIDFRKRYKKSKLDELGNWKKINKNDKRIFSKLKNRLTIDEITTAYQLEKQNIYYYNHKDSNRKYDSSTMVIFGMSQYHKDAPPRELINCIFNMLVNGTSLVSVNIDLCSDMNIKPKIDELKKIFTLKQYVEPVTKTLTETFYINHLDISMIEKLVIYNKRVKNNLNFNVWRIECLMTIPNIKYLALPLHEFKQIVDITKGIAND